MKILVSIFVQFVLCINGYAQSSVDTSFISYFSASDQKYIFTYLLENSFFDTVDFGAEPYKTAGIEAGYVQVNLDSEFRALENKKWNLPVPFSHDSIAEKVESLSLSNLPPTIFNGLKVEYSSKLQDTLSLDGSVVHYLISDVYRSSNKYVVAVGSVAKILDYDAIISSTMVYVFAKCPEDLIVFDSKYLALGSANDDKDGGGVYSKEIKLTDFECMNGN